MREGSSVGITICRNEAELAPAVEKAFGFDDEVLVERYIAGREVSVAILDDRALGAVEIAPREGFYDYANKYTRGATEYFVPPRLSPERYRGVLAQALRAHMALGCRGATRVDIRVEAEAGKVEAELRDNGRGITEAEVNGAGTLGLLGVRERAYALGGEAVIEAIPGDGTRVFVTLPQ